MYNPQIERRYLEYIYQRTQIPTRERNVSLTYKEIIPFIPSIEKNSKINKKKKGRPSQ